MYDRKKLNDIMYELNTSFRINKKETRLQEIARICELYKLRVSLKYNSNKKLIIYEPNATLGIYVTFEDNDSNLELNRIPSNLE